ncbi:sensor histidine kinase, partial [Methylobacterium sp. BTF04]|uniref:sensor histidine kinase n=1 Tax=Methylobacterium sp. BTF04 TaxID=2708300 RepID=UPI0013D8129F
APQERRQTPDIADVVALRVGEAAATTLALVVHELATNSLKYGALSAPSGTLDVSGSDHGENLAMAWTERGGPPVVPSTGPGGYGSRVPDRATTHQLDGSVSRTWDEAGAIVILTMNKAFLAR